MPELQRAIERRIKSQKPDPEPSRPEPELDEQDLPSKHVYEVDPLGPAREQHRKKREEELEELEEQLEEQERDESEPIDFRNRRTLRVENGLREPDKQKSSPRKKKKRRKKPSKDLKYDDVLNLDGEEELTVTEWRKRAQLVEPPPYLIENLLEDDPGSYGIFSGRTGRHKTNNLMRLGYCLATGTPFYELSCTKVGVSMICFEGGYKDFMQRLDKIAANFPPIEDRFHFRLSREDTAVEVLERMRTSFEKAAKRGDKVIIIDPVKYLVPGDYLDMQDADKFTRTIQQTLRDYGLTAIFTLPIRKPPSFKGVVTFDDVYSVKGGTEWVDNATFVILLERQHRVRDHTTIVACKHRVSVVGSPLDIIVKHNYDTCMNEKVSIEMEDGKIVGNL